MKKVVSLALILFLICTLTLPAEAADMDVGSIRMKVEYNGQKITGGTLTAVRVGYLDEVKLVFRKVTNHDEIENIGQSAAVTQMQNFYLSNRNHSFLVSETPVKDGVAQFTGLPKGLYLIYQKEENRASGYQALSAFLVTLPFEGKMDVDASSKPALEREAETTEPTTGTSSGSSSGGKKLPQTGQLTWPIPWMALGGMVLFGLGWWLCFGKREGSP